MAQFRRPASLSPQQQDAIEGSVDPALKNQAAHDSAASLLAGMRADVSPDTVERVLRLVDSEGLEDLAALWSGAEPVSLPGALWRLYVLHTWVQRDTSHVKYVCERGRTAAPGLRYLAGFPEPPDVDSMKRTLDEILRGAFTGDLAMALRRAAAVTMLASYGTALAADSPEAMMALQERSRSELSPESLTASAHRLLSMGEVLEAAAKQAEAGALA